MQTQRELVNTTKLLNIADPEGLLDPTKSKAITHIDDGVQSHSAEHLDQENAASSQKFTRKQKVSFFSL